MYITITNNKGGVAKTTTAIHLAAYFQRLAPTLLVDGDPNRSATAWAKRGCMPFTIADEKEGMYQARRFEHVIIDTEARPGFTDLQELARGCDLLVIPTVPATLDSHALAITLQAIRKLAPEKYRVLLAKVPPPPEQDGAILREELTANGIPLFVTQIPRLKAFEHAVAEGVPIYELNTARAQLGWEAYEAMGKEIIDGHQPK